MPQKPDSTIKRGDRTDTGDKQARLDQLGSSADVQPTIDPTSFGAESSIAHSSSSTFDPKEELLDDDGFETMMPDDGRLGLTNVGNKPAEDWAADTGPTRNPAERSNR